MKKDKKKKDYQKKQKQDDSRKYLEKMRYLTAFILLYCKINFIKYFIVNKLLLYCLILKN